MMIWGSQGIVHAVPPEWLQRIEVACSLNALLQKKFGRTLWGFDW